METKELLARVKADNIKFISYQFTDVNGAVKSVDAPIYQLEAALEDGVWFDGSSVEGFSRIQESDMRLVIDPNTYAVLPGRLWKRGGRDFFVIFSRRITSLSKGIRAVP